MYSNRIFYIKNEGQGRWQFDYSQRPWPSFLMAPNAPVGADSTARWNFGLNIELNVIENVIGVKYRNTVEYTNQ